MRKAREFSACLGKEIADIHGVDERTVRRWDEEGMPRNEDGTYNASATVAWRLERESATDLTAQRARLAREQADKTALDNAERRGDLARVSVMEAELADGFAEFGAHFFGFPSKIAPRVYGLDVSSIESVLETEFRFVVEQLRRLEPWKRRGKGAVGVLAGAVERAEDEAAADGESVGRH